MKGRRKGREKREKREKKGKKGEERGEKGKERREKSENINKGKNYKKILILKGVKDIHFPPICMEPTTGI